MTWTVRLDPRLCFIEDEAARMLRINFRLASYLCITAVMQLPCMEGTEGRKDEFVPTALLLQQHMSWFGKVGQVVRPDSIVVLSWLYISSIE